MYWLRSSVGSDLLSLPANRSRSVLAVKGSLRALDRCGPIWRDALFTRERGGGAVRVDGPKGNLSAIPDALSSSRGAAVTRRAIAQRRSRASGLTRPLAEAIRGFGLGFVVVPFPPFRRVYRKSFVFSSLPIGKVLVFPFAGGASHPLPVVSLLFSVSYPQL